MLSTRFIDWSWHKLQGTRSLLGDPNLLHATKLSQESHYKICVRLGVSTKNKHESWPSRSFKTLQVHGCTKHHMASKPNVASLLCMLKGRRQKEKRFLFFGVFLRIGARSAFPALPPHCFRANPNPEALLSPSTRRPFSVDAAERFCGRNVPCCLDVAAILPTQRPGGRGGVRKIGRKRLARPGFLVHQGRAAGDASLGSSRSPLLCFGEARIKSNQLRRH